MYDQYVGPMKPFAIRAFPTGEPHVVFKINSANCVLYSSCTGYRPIVLPQEERIALPSSVTLIDKSYLTIEGPRQPPADASFLFFRL